MLYEKLSDLTPAVVDSIYNIDVAPSVAEPEFRFVLGVPGSGKSSVRAPSDYATINVDLLLESLLPFRAASSIAHFLKSKFSSIGAYSTRKENLGMYDEMHPPSEQFNRVRERFLALRGQEATHTLNDLTSEALARAIKKHVNIVYETTAGVRKVDDIMSFIKKHNAPYHVRFIHIKASAEDIAARLRARQEHGMPQERFPFYRYVPPHVEKLLAQSEAAYATLRKKYAKVAAFEEIENPLDIARLPAENRRTASARRRHILAAYGPLVLSDRPNLYVSPTSSERRRRSTQKRKTSTVPQKFRDNY